VTALANTVRDFIGQGVLIGEHIKMLNVGSSAATKTHGYTYQTNHHHYGYNGGSGSITCDTFTSTNAMVSICMEACHLQELLISGPLAFTAIAVAGRMSAHKLGRLSITIDEPGLIQALGYLNTFCNLRELTLSCQYAEQQLPNILGRMGVWNNLHLRSLRITGIQQWCAPLTDHLAKCLFPALKILHYNIPSSTSDGASGKLVLLLRKLPPLQEASMYLRGFRYTELSPYLDASVLEVVPLRPDIIAALPMSTHRIRIQVSDAINDLANFWSVLDAIYMHDVGVQVVQLCGDGFTWMMKPNIPDSTTAGIQILPYLFRYAALLGEKGIVIWDAYGKTLSDYLSVLQRQSQA
jgi:hypothetical protein